MQAMKVSGCIACYGCLKGLDRCAIKDDLDEVFDSVRNSDITVVTSPIYYFGLSAQIKPFIDRMYQFFTPDMFEILDENGLPNMEEFAKKRYSRLAPKKTAVLITSQGACLPEMYKDVHERHKESFQMAGFDNFYSIRGLGDPEVTPKNNNMEETKMQAKELAQKLTS